MRFIVPGPKGQKLLMHGSDLALDIDRRRGKSPLINQPRPPAKLHVALLPWGYTVEDFLDGLGVSFDQFCMEMTGGWLFGYVQALQLAGFQVTIFCFSSRTRVIASKRHKSTGAEICLIPAKTILPLDAAVLCRSVCLGDHQDVCRSKAA